MDKQKHKFRFRFTGRFTPAFGSGHKRVIKQTIGKDLPPGFQRSEFLLEKGFLDHIITREDMKETLTNIIGMLE